MLGNPNSSLRALRGREAAGTLFWQFLQMSMFTLKSIKKKKKSIKAASAAWWARGMVKMGE